MFFFFGFAISHRLHDLLVSPESVQAEIADAKAHPATNTSDWYAADLKYPDGTDAEFIPAVFDVEGLGNCFFLAVTYGTTSPILPSSSFGPDVSLAMRYRNASVDHIHSLITPSYTALTEVIELLETEDLDEDARKSLIYRRRQIVNETSHTLAMEDYMPADIEFAEYKEAVERELNKMRRFSFWVHDSMSTHVASLSQYNIVIVTVPMEWTRHGRPSPARVNNRGCGMRDLLRDVKVETSEPVQERSIFVMYNGNHFMPILLLNTDPNASPENRVIHSVPSWERAKWAMLIAKYWGFAEINIEYMIEGWIKFRNCGYEGRCSLVLGHSGDHQLN